MSQPVAVVGGQGYVGSRIMAQAGAGQAEAISRDGDRRFGIGSIPWSGFLDGLRSGRTGSVIWLLDGAKHAEPDRLAELLAAARPGVGLVLVSTCTLYGARGDDLCDETEPTTPLTPHAEVKARCEQDLARSDLDWCVLRLGALYGPDRRGVRTDRATKWVTQAAADGVVVVPAPGHWRGWLHVDQAARALWRAAQTGATGVFNVASVNLTFGQAAATAADLFHAQVAADGKPDPCSFRVDATAARTAGILDEVPGEDLASVVTACAATPRRR